MFRILFFSILVLSSSVFAQSNAPFLINDTRTPLAGRGELVLSNVTLSTSDSITFQFPTIAVLHGVTNRLSFRLESAIGYYFKGAQDAKIGATNGIFGAKWRFIGDGDNGFSMGIAPQQSFPYFLTSQERTLAPHESISLIPAEISYRTPTGSLLLEGGVEKHSEKLTNKVWAFALAYNILPEFEMMVEYYNRIHEDSSGTESIVNLGGRYSLNPRLLLMLSIGQTTQIFNGDNYTYFTYWSLKTRY